MAVDMTLIIGLRRNLSGPPPYSHFPPFRPTLFGRRLCAAHTPEWAGLARGGLTPFTKDWV